MRMLWLQDSMFSSREHITSVVNAGTNQTHQNVQRSNGLMDQEPKEWEFQECFE